MKKEALQDHLQSLNKLLGARKYKEAVELLLQNELTDLNSALFQNALGVACAGLNDHERAVSHFLASIKINPLDPFPFFNIGNSLTKNLQFDEGAKYYKLALALDENCADAIVGLGVSAFQQSNYTVCDEYFERALKLQPKNAQIITNLGNSYLVQGRFDDALNLLNRALSISPELPMARTNRGLIKLGRGDFETGWEDYEYRFHEEAFNVRRFADLPLWTGPAGTNKKVFIWSEQGLGDEIMFASVFPELEECSERFFVECDSRLLEIFQSSFPKIKFLKKKVQRADGVDFQLPLASLGLIFRVTTASFRQYPLGFLKLPDTDLPNSMRDALSALPKPLIGVSWESYALTKNFRDRKSISAKDFEIITSQPNGSFVNLQYPNPHKHEKSAYQEIPDGVITLPNLDLKNDILTLGKVMQSLDYIITIGNSVAHLSGGLGIKTTVLLPSVSDWRWGYTGNTSPWYPTLSLCRNTSTNWMNFLPSINLPDNIERRDR